jgi:hypothetical protein
VIITMASTTKIKVKVQSDHLERLTAVPRPIIAIEELIWNGLDADADLVTVEIGEGELGSLNSIEVNGHGLEFPRAIEAFQNLGGSWKRTARRTRKHLRSMHGQAGRGRFRAFHIGSMVVWLTRYADDDGVREYLIRGNKNHLDTFEITQPRTVKKECGTSVVISEIDKGFRSLFEERAVQQITERFAMYLKQYPDVKIVYDGTSIDPATIEDYSEDYDLEPIEVEGGDTIHAVLTVIEWTKPTERILHLCDEKGVSLHELPPGIQARGFNFTAYLKCSRLRELNDDGSLILEDLQPEVKQIVDSAKGKLRDHFRRRSAELSAGVVETWKRENVYPYESEPKNVIEVAERQVFDVVALNLEQYLPDFDKADVRNKRLAMKLLRQALETNPSSVKKIIEEVIDLPKDKQDDFAKLLQRTTLSAVINASRVVTDRLDFLRGLELILFEADSRKALLERSQLHRIIAEHTWLFGEEFALSVDDESLDQVLGKHRALLGKREDDPDPVRCEDGSVGIVDIMLSRAIPQPKADEREHLVIELKRPSQPINSDVLAQVRKYAFAVLADERFRETNTRWIFWAVSNKMTENARREAKQKDRPEGLVWESDDGQPCTIWAKTWGQIIDAARARLKFFQERLAVAVTSESAQSYLQATYEKYLPKKK